MTQTTVDDDQPERWPRLFSDVDGCNRIKDVRLHGPLRYYNFVNLYGCELGRDVQVGAFVEIQRGVRVGDRCKISSHSFLCEGVTIGNDCFIGHGVMFTNDKNPRSSVDGRLIRDEWTCLPTVIEDGVAIGSNATILCGIRIGSGALVAAGAVVTRDVMPGTVVVGNPARVQVRNNPT